MAMHMTYVSSPPKLEETHWPHFIPGTKSAGLQVGLAGLAPAEPKHPVGGASCDAWTRSESSAQTHVVQWFDSPFHSFSRTFQFQCVFLRYFSTSWRTPTFLNWLTA